MFSVSFTKSIFSVNSNLIFTSLTLLWYFKFFDYIWKIKDNYFALFSYMLIISSSMVLTDLIYYIVQVGFELMWIFYSDLPKSRLYK